MRQMSAAHVWAGPSGMNKHKHICYLAAPDISSITGQKPSMEEGLLLIGKSASNSIKGEEAERRSFGDCKLGAPTIIECDPASEWPRDRCSKPPHLHFCTCLFFAFKFLLFD